MIGFRPADPESEQKTGHARHWTLPRFRQLSFRTRLGTLVAIAVGLTVALAAVTSYFIVRHQLISQVDSSLESDITSAQAFSPDGGLNPQRVGDILSRSNNGFIQVIDASGGVLSSSLKSINLKPMQPTTAQEGVAADPDAGYRIDTVTYDGQRYRVITEAATDSYLPGAQLAVQIGRPLGDIEHELSTLGLILWLVSLAGVTVAVVLGYAIGRTTIRPVERLTAAAEHVAATQDLSATIEIDSEDELGRLAVSFNAMLTALAASRQQQAQLISDAGHELRTPLTSLRTNIEVLMRMPDLPAADRIELTRDVEGQLQELTNLIGDLVDLARHEERDTEPIEVRLDTIVERALDRARRRASNVVFDVHLTPGSVRAQPALLERAVLNVLDNAAKWSAPGGTVEVWLQRGATWALDVHDHGPGISAEDLPYVFDRFYRATSARSMPGSGLGLAIVRQVITDHGGLVTASVPPEGGTLVHIELPTVPEMESGVPPTPPAADALNGHQEHRDRKSDSNIPHPAPSR